MSEADLEYAATPPDSEYEHTDIEPAIAGRFAVWLAVSMLISAAIVYGTFWLFESREETVNRAAVQFPMAVGRVIEPPTPRLQTQPFKDVYQLKQEQIDRLHSYGWVDQSSSIVHIPIDEAMRLLTERKLLPTAGETPDGLNQVVQDSSAGRTVAGR